MIKRGAGDVVGVGQRAERPALASRARCIEGVSVAVITRPRTSTPRSCHSVQRPSAKMRSKAFVAP
jgi:hypothetical protein